jgi:hypothetical protein
MTKLSATRILIILGVLVSLCVSDNVGPRLLPLPTVSEPASTTGPSERGQAASRTTPQGRTNGARVEMASAPQGRGGVESKSPHAAAHAPKFELAVPPAPPSQRRELYQPSAESSAPFSRPKGRAPPRLV